MKHSQMRRVARNVQLHITKNDNVSRYAPKVIPNKKALKFPLFPRPTFTLTLEIKGVNLTASISNGFEHIKSNPKITRITSSVERSKGTLIAKQGKAEEFRLRKSVGQRHRAHGITDNQRSNQYYPHKGF